jgi:putative endonuclease
VAFVYILRCRDGSLYTGIAKDVAARLRQHQAGRASRYTRARLPVALLWSRRVATWSAALREEHRIKQLRRSDKVALVARSRAARARRSRRRREGPGPGVVR